MAILDLLVSSTDPTHPGLVLAVHVVSRGVEVGSVVGLAVGLLACAPVNGGRNKVLFIFYFFCFGSV